MQALADAKYHSYGHRLILTEYHYTIVYIYSVTRKTFPISQRNACLDPRILLSRWPSSLVNCLA